jgi:hypothetical protein
MGNVVLAVFSQIGPVGVEHGGGVVIHSSHCTLVDRHHDHHLVLSRILLQSLDGWSGARLRGIVPALVLRRAEIGSVEDLLQAEDLDAVLASLLDQRHVCLERGFFDLFDLP